MKHTKIHNQKTIKGKSERLLNKAFKDIKELTGIDNIKYMPKNSKKGHYTHKLGKFMYVVKDKVVRDLTTGIKTIEKVVYLTD